MGGASNAAYDEEYEDLDDITRDLEKEDNQSEPRYTTPAPTTHVPQNSPDKGGKFSITEFEYTADIRE